MANKVPFWVYKQRETLMEMSHRSTLESLQDRIKYLEEENSNLKNKIIDMENVLLITLDLLMKKH